MVQIEYKIPEICFVAMPFKLLKLKWIKNQKYKKI